MTDLTQALAEVKRCVRVENGVWTSDEISDEAERTIHLAISMDHLLPRADADLTAALMVEKAADIIGMCDQVGADAEGPVRALVPASALAEMQALRSERDRLDAVANTLSEMWEGEQTARHSAEAELVMLRAQVERLTVKPLLFSELVDGGCMGRPHPFQYFITKNHNGRFLCHWDETWHDTLPEAQAHAQKAYQIAALTEGAAP